MGTTKEAQSKEWWALRFAAQTLCGTR